MVIVFFYIEVIIIIGINVHLLYFMFVFILYFGCMLSVGQIENKNEWMLNMTIYSKPFIVSLVEL